MFNRAFGILISVQAICRCQARLFSFTTQKHKEECPLGL